MAKMKWFDWASISLLIVGGLAWGLNGLVDFSLVHWLSMGYSWLENLIKVLVGVSALYSIYSLWKINK